MNYAQFIDNFMLDFESLLKKYGYTLETCPIKDSILHYVIGRYYRREITLKGLKDKLEKELKNESGRV